MKGSMLMLFCVFKDQNWPYFYFWNAAIIYEDLCFSARCTIKYTGLGSLSWKWILCMVLRQWPASLNSYKNIYRPLHTGATLLKFRADNVLRSWFLQVCSVLSFSLCFSPTGQHLLTYMLTIYCMWGFVKITCWQITVGTTLCCFVYLSYD